MNKFLLFAASVVFMSFSPSVSAQAPVLGDAANFALFTSVGAVTNTGLSQITGDVGTNSGAASTGFGNIDGVMQDSNAATADAAADLLTAYNQLNGTAANYFPAPLLGNGATLTAGTYSIGEAASLSGTLTLNGGGNSNSV
ncbi:MAG: ice-binding family protein, partial [Kaistella sp.]